VNAEAARVAGAAPSGAVAPAGAAADAAGREPLLELKDVTTHYGPIRVLHHVDMVIYPGEMVCLLGGNASGKSTTLKTILGIVRVSEGEIRYLAANPVIDPNRAPAVDVPDVPARAVEKRVTALTAVAFDDALPAGEALRYAWRVLSDNAADAVFGDAAARETTFTARVAGAYKIQLAVSDGERITYSQICTVEVTVAGTVFSLR